MSDNGILRIFSNYLLAKLRIQLVVKCITKKIKIVWQLKKLCPITVLNFESGEKNYGREVINSPTKCSNSKVKQVLLRQTEI